MNPWILLGLGVAWLASLATAAGFAYEAGSDHCTAVQAREERVAAIATAAAASAAAVAISGIEVRHVTIRQRTETSVRTVPVYRDCRHEPGVMRDINAARTGRAEPAGGGVLPAASAA